MFLFRGSRSLKYENGYLYDYNYPSDFRQDLKEYCKPLHT
jgi:hypothetical protein